MNKVFLIFVLAFVCVANVFSEDCSNCVTPKKVTHKVAQAPQPTRFTVDDLNAISKAIQPKQDIIVQPTPINFTPPPVVVQQAAVPVPVAPAFDNKLLEELVNQQKIQNDLVRNELSVAKSSLKWQRVGAVANVATAVFTGVTAFRVDGDHNVVTPQPISLIQTVTGNSSSNGGSSSANGGNSGAVSSSGAVISGSGNSTSQSRSDAASASNSNSSSKSNVDVDLHNSVGIKNNNSNTNKNTNSNTNININKNINSNTNINKNENGKHKKPTTIEKHGSSGGRGPLNE